MRGLVLGFCLAAMATTVHATTLEPVKTLPAAAHALPLHMVGRFVKGQADGHTVFRHQWPGVYVEAAFRGRIAFIGFDDASNAYRLTVDNDAPVAVVKPGKAWFAVSATGDGPHRLRLEKVTESIDDIGAIAGVYADAKAALPAPPARTRRIEFIGDSGMTGYGVRSDTRTCTKSEVHDRTDTQIAWPALVAKHYDADYQIDAISGRGVMRNFDSTTPGFAMGDVYPYMFFDKTVPAQPSWQPDLVILGLGGNDFSTSLKPGDPWKSEQALTEAFFAAYGRFITDLHKRYPKAWVVVQWQGKTGDAESDQMSRIGMASLSEAAHRAGLSRFAVMAVPVDLKADKGACDYHGSPADHRMLAEWTEGWLDQHPDVWRRK